LHNWCRNGSGTGSDLKAALRPFATTATPKYSSPQQHSDAATAHSATGIRLGSWIPPMPLPPNATVLGGKKVWQPPEDRHNSQPHHRWPPPGTPAA
jgi:hypothetical protein